jgi:DNA-binding transcriptional LysR family regulator
MVAIERALNTRLFDRTTDGLRPTAAGERALSRALEIQEQMIALEREVAGRDTRPEGSVRLTAVDGFFDGFLIPRLPAFYERYPNIELTLVSDLRVLDLARREADVGIRFAKPSDPKLVARRLGRSAAAFYASRRYVEAHGRPSPGWEGHSLIAMLGVGPVIGRVYADHGPKARTVLIVNSLGHVLSAVRAGIGIGLVHCILAEAFPELQRVSPLVLVDSLWAVRHVDTKNSARVGVLLDYLAEIVRASQKELVPRR